MNVGMGGQMTSGVASRNASNEANHAVPRSSKAVFRWEGRLTILRRGRTGIITVLKFRFMDRIAKLLDCFLGRGLLSRLLFGWWRNNELGILRVLRIGEEERPFSATVCGSR